MYFCFNNYVYITTIYSTLAYFKKTSQSWVLLLKCLAQHLLYSDIWKALLKVTFSNSNSIHKEVINYSVLNKTLKRNI